MKRAFKIIIILFLSNIISAQEITQAEYDFKILNWEIVDSANINTVQANSLIQSMKETVEMTVAFNNDYLCLIRKDSFGDINLRSVLKKNDSLIYTFIYMLDSKMYKIDKVSDALEVNFKDLINEEEVIENFDTISGLVCNKITGKFVSNESFEALVTNQIGINAADSHILPFNVFDGITIRITTVIDGIRITFGIDNFSREDIDDSLFSVSTEGYESMLKVLDEMKKLNEVEPTELKKGNGTNLGIIKKLIKTGIIEKNEYFEYLVEYNIDVDKISILIELKDQLEALDNTELIVALIAFDLYSERAKEFNEKYYQKKDSIKNDMFLNAILLATLKDHLNDPGNRSAFVKNLKADKYKVSSESVDSFINGKLDFYDFLISLDIFDELPEVESNSTFEVKKNAIKIIFNNALGEELDSISFTGDDHESFYIAVNNINYRIPLEKIKNTAQNPELYKHKFSKLVLDVVKQVAVDNDIKKIFNIYSYKDMFKTVISPDDYNKVTKEFPELKIFRQPYAMVHCSRDFALETDKKIGLSFFTKDNIEYKQLTCKSFCRCSDMVINYAKTQIKNDFIDYISKNKEKYSLNDKELELFKQNLLDTLVRYRYWIMDYVPDLVYKSEIYFGKDIKELPPVPNSFESSFPRLYKFLRGDFQADNFKFEDSDKKKITFNYKGEIISVKANETDLLKKVISLLKKNNNFTKNIYQKSGYPIYEWRYYYLSLKEKKEFQDVLDFRMTPVFK